MDKYCYNGLLWLAQGEDVNIYDAESGDLLVEDFTLTERKDIIELPAPPEPITYKTDSQYYVDHTNWFFTLSDRKFRKTVAGPAYGAGVRRGQAANPIFVSMTPEYATYRCPIDNSQTAYRTTCTFGGETWYIAGGSYGFSNTSVDTLPFVPDDITSEDWSYIGLNFLQHIYNAV